MHETRLKFQCFFQGVAIRTHASRKRGERIRNLKKFRAFFFIEHAIYRCSWQVCSLITMRKRQFAI